MKIIFPNGSGGIAVIHPTGELPIEAVMEKDVPAEFRAQARIVDDEAIPGDRTFRNAWVEVGGSIAVDLPKARDIHRDNLRSVRGPLLEALDVAYQRADEAGDADAKKAVAARKQELRDITELPAIDAAKTPEELAAITIAA